MNGKNIAAWAISGFVVIAIFAMYLYMNQFEKFAYASLIAGYLMAMYGTYKDKG